MGTKEWRKEPKEGMRVETKKFVDWVSTLPNLSWASFLCPHSFVQCLLLSFCPPSFCLGSCFSSPEAWFRSLVAGDVLCNAATFSIISRFRQNHPGFLPP